MPFPNRRGLLSFTVGCPLKLLPPWHSLILLSPEESFNIPSLVLDHLVHIVVKAHVKDTNYIIMSH